MAEWMSIKYGYRQLGILDMVAWINKTTRRTLFQDEKEYILQ